MAESFGIEIRGSVGQWTKDILPRVLEARKSGLLKAAEIAAGEVRRAIFEAFPGGRGGLARSYTATLLQPKDGKLRAGAVSDLIYARIQDEGGLIKPVNAKALAIPVSAKAKALAERGAGPRDGFTGAENELHVVWKKGSSTGVLMNADEDVHYVLAKQSRVKGKRYLDKAAKHAEPQITEVMEKELQKALKESKAGGE